MIYKWFFIVNYNDFLALDLVSKTYTLIFDGIGQRDILVTKVNRIALTFDGVFLPLSGNVAGEKIEMDGYAAYIDAASNLWLGFLQG